MINAGFQVVEQADHVLLNRAEGDPLGFGRFLNFDYYEVMQRATGGGELCRDGILAKPASYAHTFPDLLTFHDAPTPIEQKLFVMHLERRMRAFQGTFHANPDYALWYGWSELKRDLAEIKTMAAELREKHAAKSKP